jgi:PAS domain S-box-containing protein
MAIPMVVGDKLLGVLDVQSSDVDGFTEEDANIKMTLASQIAVALQNAQTYAEAEQTRQEAQSLVDFAAEGIAIIDLETVTWTAPNENFAQVFGMTRDEVSQTGPVEMSPSKQPDGRASTEKAEELISKALNEGPQTFEWVHLNADGDPFDCEIRLVALPGDKPRIRQSIVDITERKRQAEETARRARHETALNLISQKIQNAATIEEAMQITARELGQALGKRQTLVALDPAALAADGGKKVVNE